MTEKEDVEVLPDPCFPLPHVGFPLGTGRPAGGGPRHAYGGNRAFL